METLFARHKPKKSIIGLMLVGSLVLHGGLVGIASLWTPSQPKDHTVFIDVGDAPPEGPTPIYPAEPPSPSQPEIPVLTATPEPIDPVAPTPPISTEDPVFAELAVPMPPMHWTTAVKPPASNRPASIQPTSRTSAGPSNSSVPGVGNPAGLAGNWVMPHPPYPRMLGTSKPTGQTTLRVTTDAAGRISNVVIVKSTGNPVLNNHTSSYVRNNWHGPPNASRTMEFVYELK